MKRLLSFFHIAGPVALLFLAAPTFADPNRNQSLDAVVARQTLRQVLSDIASDIGEMRRSFPQLKEWDRAEISPVRIRYQYAHCDLLIDSRETPEFAGDATALKIGVYLKLTAAGERAEEFKNRIESIVAMRFQKIRDLRSAVGVH